MLYATIFLVLATLYNPCLAAVVHESPFQADAKVQKYSCRYTVHKDTTLSEVQWPQEIDSYRTDTTSLNECTAYCDTKKNCVAASYYPHAKGGVAYPKCIGVKRTGFATLKLTPSKAKGLGVAQLVANSCNKPVATAHPVGCKPGTQTNTTTGCQYKITCDVEMRREKYYAMSVGLVQDNTAACYKYLQDPFGPDIPGYGYSFYQGGLCMVNVDENHQLVSTAPRPNAQTIQLIPGSC